MDTPQFIHPPADGYLGCFGYLVVFAYYKRSCYKCVQVFVWVYAFISHGSIPKSGMAGSYGRCLTIYLFIYVRMYVCMYGCLGSSLLRGLSLVVASGGYSSLWCMGFSLQWLLLLQSTGSRRVVSVVVARRL